MPTCTSCRTENPQRAKFCLECGMPLAARCGTCGTELPPAAKFCLECGVELKAVEGVGGCGGRGLGGGPVTPNPLSAPLADKIRRAKPSMEGERKQITVLFADVKGSMDLAEQLDAEAWSAIMQRFFTILSEGVARFEGFVDKFTGDGIMALFGAPIAHEDHAQRACYAALRLQGEVARYATELKRRHGVGFSTRMGINSGEVVVGTIGDDLRMSYTAQGHTVGLAQRMEALASPDSCYVSAATAALVSGYVQLEDLGEFQLKGASAPMRVHRLVGVGTARTRLDVSRTRGLSTFVGRDADMATLDAALAQAQAGHGQVVGVVAAAGTGKSRLCWEFAERCRARGIVVNTGTAVAHGRNIPYLPMLEVFRAYFGIREEDDGAIVREKIAGRLLLLDESFREVLPILFEFFQAPDPERRAERMDPEAKQRQFFAVIRRVIQDPRAGATRVIALLEDLHWFDAASETLLAQWIEAIAGSTSLLIVNFRPEYRAAWMQQSYYRRLPLAPLGGAAIRALLGDLLGADASTQALADAIHAHTGGNPFFTEEVVQSLIESGQLQGSRGAYRLVAPVERLAVPPSVQALLAARIDRLGEREKQVLQTAAVIGKEFSEPILRQVLAAIAPVPDDVAELTGALDALKARELVYETSLYPVALFAFKHPLTHEVALGSQLQERRRQVHAAVAQAIEATHRDNLDEHAALLAHHAAEAGEPLAAAGWHARAAQFIGRNDFAEASRHWERARVLLRDLGDPAAAPLAADACFQLLALGGFRLALGPRDAESLFDEGLAWADRTAEPRLRGRLHQAMAVLEIRHGHVDAALRQAVEWERIARALGDDDRRASALWPTLEPLMLRGDLDTARANARQQIAWMEGHPEWGMRDWGLSALAAALGMMSAIELLQGSCAEALEYSERALRAARSVGDAEMEAAMAADRVRMAAVTGDPDMGRPFAQRAVELGERLGRSSRSWGYQALGTQQLLDGDPGAARASFEHALAIDGGRRGRIFHEVRAELARAHLAAGDAPRARQLAADAFTDCLDAGTRPAGIAAAVTLAMALRAADGLAVADRIEEVLATADRLIAETGARNLSPRVALERGSLAALRGDVSAQTLHLRGALDGFTRMGATGWARVVTAALAELSGADG